MSCRDSSGRNYNSDWAWGRKNELPRLETILSNLKAIANKVRTDIFYCEDVEEQLKSYCYDWFGDILVFEDEEQVMKVFSVAVNEAIQKKVDLANVNTEVVNRQLRQLLDIEDKFLYQYFSPSPSSPEVTWSRIQNASSPLDMAECLKKGVLQWFVKNIIQHQFEMSWNTVTGGPVDYTFYEFCDKKNTTELLKYIPRQAHVKATLYKECRTVCLQSITKEELCPKVYIKTSKGWKTWDAVTKAIKNNDDSLEWIDESITTFIFNNADEQDNDFMLSHSLTKPTLYWAVLEDEDFERGKNLKLNEIGKTQVYVGKANNGILGRWINDKDNHCQKMKECLDNVRAMTTYEPLRLEGIQLVDARLALAKVRDEKTALFVIKTFGDDVKEAHWIVQLTRAEKSHRNGKRVDRPDRNIIPHKDYKMTWKPTNMGYGMNKS